MNVNNNVFTKKTRKWFFDMFRSSSVVAEGAVLVNSIPKSGTHLLTQVVSGLGKEDFGGFITSTPSFSMRLQDDKALMNDLKKRYKNEMASAHIHYSLSLEKFIKDLKLKKLFIYRDPRAVFVSEMEYLTEMNRWHRCSKYYRSAESTNERFNLSLNGINDDFYYPEFNKRIEDYLGWLSSESCLPVKFEDLAVGNESTLLSIGDYLLEDNYNKDLFIDSAKKVMNAKSSHTYSGKKRERWKDTLTHEQLVLLEGKLGSVIEKMGYK